MYDGDFLIRNIFALIFYTSLNNFKQAVAGMVRNFIGIRRKMMMILLHYGGGIASS